MLESFKVTFSQIFVLFTFIAIGYALKKSGKVSDNFNKGLSNLLVYIFVPFLIFGNMSENFKLELLADKISLILIASGMLVGGFNIRLPQVAETIIDTGANCMAPAAMILTGIVFASNDLKKMLSNVKVYIACAIKMVIIPVIAVLIIVAVKVPENIAILMITVLTLPTGLNSIVFPEAYGGDSNTGAQLCFVSTFTCLIFIPVFFEFYRFLCR